MILISGYTNDLYDELLSEERGWRKEEIKTHTRDTKGKDYAKTEVLWKNRVFCKAKASGRVPIRLSRKEKSENKINPPR